MVVFSMIGVLACLVFLCVSPLVGQLASLKADNAAPSKPRPIQKQTLSAR